MPIKTYSYLGIRPSGNQKLRLEKAVKKAAANKGHRITLSALVNECIGSHLPRLEARYGLEKKAA